MATDLLAPPAATPLLPRGARLLEVRPFELGDPDGAQPRHVNGRTVAGTPGGVSAGAELRAAVDALEGGGPLHALIWLRPPAEALPRAWAAAVLDGSVEPFEPWLRTALGSAPDAARLDGQDAIVGRWVSLLGVEQVTAVVVDEADAGRLAGAYEALLGAPDPAIADRNGWAHRAPTFAEIEVVRALNAAWRQVGLDRGVHAEVVRDGIASELANRTPTREERAPALPGWAAERAGELGRAGAGAIAASGVRVFGDLQALSRTGWLPPGTSDAIAEAVADTPPVSERAWAEVGAAAALGTLIASGATRRRRRGRRHPAGAGFEPLDLARMSSRALAILLLRRRLRVTVRKLRGRRRGPNGA